MGFLPFDKKVRVDIWNLRFYLVDEAPGWVIAFNALCQKFLMVDSFDPMNVDLSECLERG